MEFPGIDADDWTVCDVEVADMEGILPVMREDVVVEFVPGFCLIESWD